MKLPVLIHLIPTIQLSSYRAVHWCCLYNLRCKYLNTPNPSIRTFLWILKTILQWHLSEATLDAAICSPSTSKKKVSVRTPDESRAAQTYINAPSLCWALLLYGDIWQVQCWFFHLSNWKLYITCYSEMHKANFKSHVGRKICYIIETL